MALQEEYEYAAFRCAFCNFFNPAKKLRPMAPKLLSEATPAVQIQKPSTSSDSSSDSDADLISRRKISEASEDFKVPQVQQQQQPITEVPPIADDDDNNDESEVVEKPEIEKKLE